MKGEMKSEMKREKRVKEWKKKFGQNIPTSSQIYCYLNFPLPGGGVSVKVYRPIYIPAYVHYSD